MKELALIALFAQTTQPVLADEAVEGMVYLMFVGAVVAQWAMAFAEGLAYGTVGVEAESVFLSEEVGKGEIVGL